VRRVPDLRCAVDLGYPRAHRSRSGQSAAQGGSSGCEPVPSCLCRSTPDSAWSGGNPQKVALGKSFGPRFSSSMRR